jgi:hypothetical protein
MLENKKFLSSEAYREIADVVYAETIHANDFSKKESRKVKEVWRLFLEEHNSVKYKYLEFKIYENSTIFCDTELINDLFVQLDKVDKIKNINLITHQSDEKVNSKIFEKKPKCIKNWYGINIGHDDKNLIPIPMGLADGYAKKNLHNSDFQNLEFDKFFNKEDVSIYINFQINTNFTERAKLYKKFRNKSWVFFDDPNLNKKEYINNLKKSTYVLCPWGNGVDTHRVWETLYAGSIPIVRYHETFKNSLNLPILFVNDYNQLTKDFLDKWYKENKYKNFDFSSLDISWWEEKISKKIDENNSITLKETETETIKLEKEYTKKVLKRAKNKKLITFNRKIKKFLFYRFLLKLFI